MGGECIFIPSKQPGEGIGGGGGDVSAGPGNGTAGAVATAQEQDAEDEGYLVTFVCRKDGTGNSGALPAN